MKFYFSKRLKIRQMSEPHFKMMLYCGIDVCTDNWVRLNLGSLFEPNLEFFKNKTYFVEKPLLIIGEVKKLSLDHS